MSRENFVEIPTGSGNKYRYEYVDGDTKYRGPVGDAPALSEEQFFQELAIWPNQETEDMGKYILANDTDLWKSERDKIHSKVIKKLGGREKMLDPEAVNMTVRERMSQDMRGYYTGRMQQNLRFMREGDDDLQWLFGGWVQKNFDLVNWWSITQKLE